MSVSISKDSHKIQDIFLVVAVNLIRRAKNCFLVCQVLDYNVQLRMD